MFVASHIAAGSLLYDALKDEPDLHIKVPLVLGGLFVSHWLLDIVPVVHDMSLFSIPAQTVITAYNVAAVALLWYGTRRERRWWLPSPRMLYGLAAWLMWDVWWLVDSQGGPHRLTTMFDGIERWTDPRSFVVEALWIVFAVLVSMPAVREWRAKRGAGVIKT